MWVGVFHMQISAAIYWKAEMMHVARSSLKQIRSEAQVVKCWDSITKPRGKVEIKPEL